MAALGQQLFSKELTTTDVDHRFHWPPEHLTELPDFNGGHQVGFTAKDIDGRVWKFRCSKRKTGHYRKPVVSAGWVPFLRSKGVIKAGDQVLFYRSTEPDAHFAIRFKRQIRKKINADEVKKIRKRLDDIASNIGRLSFFHTQTHYAKLKWVVIWLWDKKKPMLKWTFILLNVGLELCQATFSQEAGDGKMKGSQYRKLAFIFSAICLTLSLVELLQEGWTEGVKWTKNRGWYWFHYPGEDGPIFGKFSQWFGLASVLVQFSLNLVSLVIKRSGVLKFDILGPLLSGGYFILALLGERTAMGAKVRCNAHGTDEAEAELVQGTWVFTCHKCLQRPHEI